MKSTNIQTPLWTADDPAKTRKAALWLIAQAGYTITPDLLGALEAIGAKPYRSEPRR